MPTKHLGSTGRWGIRYGQLARRRTKEVEEKQKQKQKCTFCNGRAKRLAKGIWQCGKCGKKFAGHAYYLEVKSEVLLEEKLKKLGSKEKNVKSKLLKEEKTIENKNKEEKSEVKKTKKAKKAE
jgi:large subunit ribosomal protein L37Ae